MKHELSELNQYTGFLLSWCALALTFCVFLLGRIGEYLMGYWHDYRKVNHLDAREEMDAHL